MNEYGNYNLIKLRNDVISKIVSYGAQTNYQSLQTTVGISTY